MKQAKAARIQKKVENKLLVLSKEVRQLVRQPFPATDTLPQLLFIIGCQRSGTTMMTHIFEKDHNAKVYPEHSRLSNQDELDGLRLNPLPEVEAVLRRSRFPLVVLKPLVETQRATALLDHFPNSRAVWLYRHYADVANSNLNRFGRENGIKNLRFIAQHDPTNWRSESVPAPQQALVDRLFAETMDPHDAAALFWIVRNSYFYTLGLDQDPRVLMVRYNDLTAEPAAMMARIYQHAGRPFPGSAITADVHRKSVGKGRQIDLSPEIETLCDEMLQRLDRSYAVQNQALTLEQGG